MTPITAANMNYDALGAGYRRTRVPDPRIARRIHEALGDAISVVNVGAGTGAYEPRYLEVVAVEPSAAMIAARPPGSAPAVMAGAESLPFPAASFDAALGVLTLHHWRDLDAGLAEMRRVVRKRVVLFTWDPEFEDALWLTVHYLPRIRERDRINYPTMRRLASALGELSVAPVPIPHDCSDGFLGAWWRRPEAYLDPDVRAGISSFSRVKPDETAAVVEKLRRDLETGGVGSAFRSPSRPSRARPRLPVGRGRDSRSCVTYRCTRPGPRSQTDQLAIHAIPLVCPTCPKSRGIKSSTFKS